ncbi:S-adenosyl methyltransferase [Saccharopolyspora erythraea NRRL 2338]|nr:hypothetical protein N599_27205 [Saccharopolyspora erythraea D]PFG97639.1 S-adenosyl methyltransferase [Saccharopolyspora erythraea NRRL 2338]
MRPMPTQDGVRVPSGVDGSVPSAARIYDWLLGGSHNFEADRRFGQQLLAQHPYTRHMAMLNRNFLRVAVEMMLEAGIRQFLDLGSGIPTVGNVHEIAHRHHPESRVLYVDNEAVAVAHTEILLKDTENATMVQSDACDVDAVLGDERTREMLDLSQPLGLLAVTLFHYVAEESDPARVMARYRDVLAPGSVLAMTHLFTDRATEEIVELMRRTQNNVFPRTREEIAGFFGDLDVEEPGLAPVSSWLAHQGIDVDQDAGAGRLLAGVARKR